MINSNQLTNHISWQVHDMEVLMETNFMVYYFEVAKDFNSAKVDHFDPNLFNFKDCFKAAMVLHLDYLMMDQSDPNPFSFNQCY